MTEPAGPQPTPEQFAAVKNQMTGTGPDAALPSEEEMGARAAAAGADPTSVDVNELLKTIQKQQAAMQARIDELLKEKAAGTAVPVRDAAQSLRDLIVTHAAHTPGTDHGEVLRLADDAVDAAVNAASSGAGGPVIAIAAKIAKALKRVHPGPGDHHYFRQALDFAETHLPDAAEQLTPHAPSAGEVGSSQPPAKVISGSVTG